MNQPADQNQSGQKEQIARWWIYIAALILPLLMLGGRMWLGESMGRTGEYPTLIVFTVPIILCAYWGGLFPGLVATLTSYLGASFFLLPPIYSFAIADTKERWQQVSLILAGVFISIICELLHRSRQRMEKVVAALRRKESELETALAGQKSGKMASIRLAAIVEFSDDAIIGKDLNSVVTSWNQGAEKIFGYTAAEMVGTSIMRLIPANRQEEENHILGKIRKGESVEHFETQRQTKGGWLIHVSVTASPIKDAAGQIVGVSKVARDITEAKRAEKTLLEAQALYHSLVEQIPAGIFRKDADGRYVFVNSWFCRLSATKPADYLGKTSRESLRELAERGSTTLDVEKSIDLAASGDKHHAAIMQTGAGIELDEERILADGRKQYLHVVKVPVFDSDGKIAGTQGMLIDITERRQAEEARRASEARYHTLFDCAPDGIVVVDSRGYYRDVNASICRMLGYTRDEFIGLNATDIVAPAEIPHIGQALDVIKTKSDYQREWQFRRKDGSVFAVDTIATAMPDGNLLAMIRDITERKQAEAALHQSQDHLRIVTENARVGLVMINHERRYTFANGAYAEILGLPTPNIVGQRIADVLATLYEDQIAPRLDRAFAGERVAYELQKPAAEGDRFYSVKYEPTKMDSAAPLVVVVITDITDQKRRQEELTLKTAFLEAQVDSALDAILVVNDRAKVILRNQRLAELFKIPEDIVRDDDDNKMLQYVTSQVKNPKQFLERVRHLYEHPEEIGRDEIELVGGTILDRYSAPVRGKAGKYYGRIWTFRDITDRRKLEAQFRQSQKMEGIGQLAGGVAHDFNNILAVIQMQATLLQSDGTLSAEQTEFADEINTTVQRAAALTRQLLLFSRREVFQPRDLDLNESIAETTKMLKRILGETIRMQLKLPSQPMFLHADSGMIDQILLNLVVNARDAMPNGGQLVIETAGVEFDELAAAQSPQARVGSFVRLSVSDSGSGIAPEIMQKIFEPFFTTKEVGKGTGLGLATVFGIVQQHQGWINVYSEVGHGTTFKIYLPRLARNAGPKTTQPALADMRGGTETILLVEDDPTLRLSVRKALAQLGYRILEAPTGVKALEVWQQNRGEIRLLLTDLVMPGGMTGKNLAERIRQEDPQMKIIYMSGYSAEVVGKDFPLKEGVNFLTKPFQAVKLTETIRNCLNGI